MAEESERNASASLVPYCGETPEGWAVATIDQLSIPNRIAYGVLKPGPNVQNGVPMLRVKDLKNGLIDTSEVYRISHELDSEFKRSRLRGGEVLLSIQGTVGRVAIVPEELAGANVSRTLAVIPPVIPEFGPWIWTALQTPIISDTVSAKTGGTTRDSLNLRDLRTIAIPVAPLAEQKRIVAKVEALLDLVSRARERLNRVPGILKRFRQSVLAAACSGRLTADWRKDSGTDDRLPHGWDEVLLDNLLRDRGIFDGPFGSNLKTADYTQSGVRVIRMENIGHLEFKIEKESFISRDKYEHLTKHTVGEGDIIFASFISDEIRACVLPRLPTAIAKADCFCIRPIESIDRTYLAYQLVSQESYNQLRGAIHGATRPRVNIRQLRQLSIRICPHPEQQEIVRRVESLLEFARRVEQQVIMGSEHTKCISQSVLAKAFAGGLVDSEADLARRERREFEPANTLLERIHLSLEANVPPSPKRRAKKMAKARKAYARRPLHDVLSEARNGLSPEQLLERAGFDEATVEEFYRELRDAINAGIIIEERVNNAKIQLTAGAT